MRISDWSSDVCSSDLPITENPGLHAEFSQWSRSRQDFNAALASSDPEAARRGWQRSYLKGEKGDGMAFEQHATKLGPAPFTAPTRSAQVSLLRDRTPRPRQPVVCIANLDTRLPAA